MIFSASLSSPVTCDKLRDALSGQQLWEYIVLGLDSFLSISVLSFTYVLRKRKCTNNAPLTAAFLDCFDIGNNRL